MGADVSSLSRSRAVAALLPSRMTGDSAALGWNDLLACSYAHPERADFTARPSSDVLIVHITSGTYDMEIRRRGHWVRTVYEPGSICVIPPGEERDLRWRSLDDRPRESASIYLTDRLFADADVPTARRPSVFDRLKVHEPFLAAACAVVAEGLRHSAPAIWADSMAQALAHHLLFRPGGEAPAPAGGGRLGARLLDELVGYMNDNLSGEVTLDVLARLANMSKYHLLRQFKATTGVTPGRFLTDLRMQRGAELLASGDQTVQTIANACGYASASRFAAAFCRHTGLTPTAYRRTA